LRSLRQNYAMIRPVDQGAIFLLELFYGNRLL
jgi:hypothetical protein